MDRSTDRYLHKKFKKQLNVEPSYQIEEKTRTSKIIEPLQNNQYQQSNKISEHIPVINSNDVPNVSTNTETILSVTVSESSNAAKSSISQLNLISIKDNSENPEHDVELLESQSSNGCISFVFSKSNRVKFLDQPEPQLGGAANFDTRFNVSEPIPTVSKSSILNIYPNHYVTSKLVNIDKLEDIFSINNSVSNNDHILQHDDSSKNDSKSDNHINEFGSSEKNSSGKYICSYCNLACSKPSVLQKHIRAHTNERPYPCVSCGFSFKTRSNLYKHCRSRTHANRVMGNKTQEITNDIESDRTKMDYIDLGNSESVNEDTNNSSKSIYTEDRGQCTDTKTKPYKPRFHTAKMFFDNLGNTEDQKISTEARHSKPSNSDLLSLHINEVINKNNAIVNSNEPYLLRKRSLDHSNSDHFNNNEFIYNQSVEDKCNEEPLNLTNKTRKRCLSEVAEPTMRTSLIKELLLKNLYADSMQCPHCKMIFQTVTELELHKMRSCKGFTKSGARYSRSSSVNVASILTKNKNAFDTIPHLQNTTFSLKSPGPFLGKTQLVESDKTKSFSFDDGLPNFQNNLQNSSDILRSPLHYSISPLTVRNENPKKAVKLFGGEVKITHSSGTTKSFKIDNKDDNKYDENNFTNYSGRLSENRVIKSSLQSGGTMLQNKPNYSIRQDSLQPTPDVIRVYENTSLSPNIDFTNLERTKFELDGQNREFHGQKLNSESDSIENTIYNKTTVSYKNSNIIDFSQKAVKLFTPNLKQLNLTIPGIPVPSMPAKIISPCSPMLSTKLKQDLSKMVVENKHIVTNNSNVSDLSSSPKSFDGETIQFNRKSQKLSPISVPSPVCLQGSSIYNPVNLLVNGKIVRYVPGMPGPDIPTYNFCSPNINFMDTSSPVEPNTFTQNLEIKAASRTQLQKEKKNEQKSPKFGELEIKTSDTASKMTTKTIKNDLKSPSSSGNEVTRKFVRPNTLALKPSVAFSKQHHGLTPTMFNQILISPDTPRVSKKYIQHFLHGNYFSYLGLKSSTKSVYCTLNKTQPFYVPHFKKLSMYSEWRQQDIKGNKLYVSGYDSRQRQLKYVTAGKTVDLVVHSSYKFVTDVSCKSEEHRKTNSIIGGYESNEDYTYIRGRGRGRYVCDQCGIRCKKPSMLKKHIRTHTNDRPFTCNHCNFSFKTKGNLTKHMKSKVHNKNHAASSSSSMSTQQSGTQSSDSETEDSGMDSSDESTRQQEHEAAYGLLSLSQKNTQNTSSNLHIENMQSNSNVTCSLGIRPLENLGSFMNNEQVTQVNNSNFAKNKILDQQITLNFNSSKIINDTISNTDASPKQMGDINVLGKTNTSRPLTYPYTSDVIDNEETLTNSTLESSDSTNNISEQRNILTYNNVQKQNTHYLPFDHYSSKSDLGYRDTYKNVENIDSISKQVESPLRSITPVVKINDRVVLESFINNSRKRQLEDTSVDCNSKSPKTYSDLEAMDLSMPSILTKNLNSEISSVVYNGALPRTKSRVRMISGQIAEVDHNLETLSTLRNLECKNLMEESNFIDEQDFPVSGTFNFSYKFGSPKHNKSSLEMIDNNSCEIENPINLKTSFQNGVDINYIVEDNHSSIVTTFTEVSNTFASLDYDNSAMETLADVATKQVKLEKNTLAKSVASEYLKLATKYEFQNNDGVREMNNFTSKSKEVNELIVKPEENKNCTICAKNFNKPSQLRLHMNIHYLERPFRCDPCSVSFRTKGHLQKHERSASHHNKLSSSPLLSSSEPRPFKCSDCNIAFRIHGHLAKHLRSKMHIMKLECLAKIPFGLYAELERANSLLTEINTTDGDQCLESLKALARKVFINDPNKLNQLEVSLNNMDTSDS